MSKSEKMLDAYKDFVKEIKDVEAAIAALPRGYISEKKISGHVYHYLQWREGDHVLSQYVNESLIPSIRQKIVIRKEYEKLLKILNKDLAKLEKALLKKGVTKEQLDAARE